MDVGSATATLGVTRGASWAEIRHAYTTRLRAVHPDTGVGDTGALAAVRAAYKELAGTYRSDAVREAATAGLHVDVYA